MLGSAPRRLIAGIFVSAAALISAELAITSQASAMVGPRVKPPAPGPAYVSKSDYDVLALLADELEKKHYANAAPLIEATANPVAKSLGQWLYFMSQDPDVSISHADAFLDAHADWPATGRIQAFVESIIPKNAPPAAVLAFFDTREPVSGEGKIHLAAALFATGKAETAMGYLRDAWINHNFTISEERNILSTYRRKLAQADHTARVDRLLWARQVTNARRLFSELSSHERKKARVRAAFIVGAAGAPELYEKLSREDQLDSGVLLAAVRYYRRSGNEPLAIQLASRSPKDPEKLRNSYRWWYERQLLMRWALKENRFADAYTAASNHGLEKGGDFAEAEFNAGWIALRFLNEPARAETHFLALASAVKTPISLSRAFYWLGRAAEASGQVPLSKAYYQAAAKHYYSYYGQLAAEKLGGDALSQKFSPPIVSTPADKARFGSRATVGALRILADLGLDYEFMVFSYHVDDELEFPGEYLELADLANGEGAPHLTVRAGKVAIQRGAFTPEVAYPLVFVPEEAKAFAPPEMILALSRQESEFNPRAFSRAGARGVMQLMPTTAQITARKERLPYSRSALLDDPVYNMTIGSAHLSHLMNDFDGSLILTFAAYNAGKARADQWIETYGDPRTDAIDPVDWVELIPFSETRNYVQRVLENMQVYRGRLNDAPIPGRLTADLERGGIRGRVAQAGQSPSPVLIAASENYGAQSLTPLPAATAERAAQYRLSLALFAAPAATASAIALGADQQANKPAEKLSRKNAEHKKSVTMASVPASLDNQTDPPASAKVVATQKDEPVKIDASSSADLTAISAPTPAIAAQQSAMRNNTTSRKAQIDDLIAKIYSQRTDEPPVEISTANVAGDTPPIDVTNAEAARVGFILDQERRAMEESNEVEDALAGCPAYREFLERNYTEENIASGFDQQMLDDMVERGVCR